MSLYGIRRKRVLRRVSNKLESPLSHSFIVTFHNSVHSLMKRGLIRMNYGLPKSEYFPNEYLTHLKFTDEGRETVKELLKG